MQTWKLQLPVLRSWSFDFAVPKLELGNQKKEYQIPLPPLDVQTEIEGYQKEIELLKAKIAYQEMNIQKEIAHVWDEKNEQG